MEIGFLLTSFNQAKPTWGITIGRGNRDLLRDPIGSYVVALRPFPDPAEVQGDAFPVIDTSPTKIIVKLDSVAPTIDISPTHKP